MLLKVIIQTNSFYRQYLLTVNISLCTQSLENQSSYRPSTRNYDHNNVRVTV